MTPPDNPVRWVAWALGLVLAGFVVGMPFLLLFMRWWWRLILCGLGGMHCEGVAP